MPANLQTERRAHHTWRSSGVVRWACPRPCAVGCWTCAVLPFLLHPPASATAAVGATRQCSPGQILVPPPPPTRAPTCAPPPRLRTFLPRPRPLTSWLEQHRPRPHAFKHQVRAAAQICWGRQRGGRHARPGSAHPAYNGGMELWERGGGAAAAHAAARRGQGHDRARHMPRLAASRPSPRLRFSTGRAFGGCGGRRRRGRAVPGAVPAFENARISPHPPPPPQALHPETQPHRALRGALA